MFYFFNAHHENRRFAKLRSLEFFESSVLFVLVGKVLYNYHETIGASSLVDQTWNNLGAVGRSKTSQIQLLIGYRFRDGFLNLNFFQISIRDAKII